MNEMILYCPDGKHTLLVSYDSRTESYILQVYDLALQNWNDDIDTRLDSDLYDEFQKEHLNELKMKAIVGTTEGTVHLGVERTLEIVENLMEITDEERLTIIYLKETRQ